MTEASSKKKDIAVTVRQKSRIVGRILRLATVIFLLNMVAEPLSQASLYGWRLIGLYFLALVGIYSALHIIIDRFVSSLNKWIGSFLAILPAIFIATNGGVAGTISAITYIAVSLLIVAVCADGGCEVMAIPSLIFGRYTHLACIVFSPIDWLERKIYELIGVEKAIDEKDA